MHLATPLLPLASVDTSAKPNVQSIVRNLAHDLRQPLSAIESIAFYLDLMMGDEDPKTRKQVHRLRELVQQTNWVVSNAVHSTGSAPISLTMSDAGTLAAEAATAWASTTSSQVMLIRPDQARFQLLDEQQISLVLANVLSFVARGSAVHVTVTTGEDHSEIEIGARQMQLPDSDSLALRATRRVVSQHGGTLELFDSPLVRIRLPYRF